MPTERTEAKPALFSRTELAHLEGSSDISKERSYVFRHRIIKKIKAFTSLELPLLHKTGPNLNRSYTI